MVKPLVGLMAATVFIISLFPIPLPYGTSSHAIGTPLAAIIVGPWMATLLSVIALFLQAVFFAHGGLTTLGANVFSMGIVGSFVSYGLFKSLRKMQLPLVLAVGISAFVGDLAVYLVTSLQLALALHDTKPLWDVWVKFLLIFMPTQLPLALVEGIFTGGVFGYLKQIRPDILLRIGLNFKQAGDGNETL